MTHKMVTVMKVSATKLFRFATLIMATALIAACAGDDGASGPTGTTGPAGPPGIPGTPGTPPSSAIIIGDGSTLTMEQVEALGKLQASITGVSPSDKPVVDFTVVDGNGNPAVGIAPSTILFTFAKLVPADPNVNGGLPYWQSYINRTATSNRVGGLATAVQATNDRNGTLVEVADGQYQYTFSNDVTSITTPIAVAWEPNLTHRVGMEIRLGGPGEVPLAPFNPVYDFVPDGGAGSMVTKNIADTNNCADCHFEFTMHGGPRKSVEYCVTCHNPGSVDPDSGESVDMAYLAHSIHKGADRTTPYVIYGFGGTPHDYSEVHYPQSTTYCETCHTASATHADGDNWNEGATAKACGGCHDNGLVAQNYDPVTGQAEYLFDHSVAEVDLGILPDGECAGCHLGVIPTAGPALAVHSAIRGDDRVRAAAGDNFVFEILGATNTAPGDMPVITFRVSDPAGNPYNIFTDAEFTDINAALNLYVAWSTDDYYGGDENGQVLGGRINDDLSIQAIQDLNFRDTGYPYRMRFGAIKDAIQNGGGSTNADGSYSLPFFTALPDAFTGDIAVGLGGHPAWEYTDSDGVTAFDRASAVSAVYFPGQTRQAAFDSENCNACHERLQAHGGNRNGNVEFCLLCHNADAAVCSTNPEADGSCPVGGTEEGYHFGRMIHSIHTASPTYEGGAFAEVKYPQTAANCETCHTPGSYNVARPTARAVSTSQGADIRVWTDDIASTPTVAACSVCHTSSAATGHFLTQAGQVDDLKCTIVGANCGAPDGSSGSGLPNGQEACAVCHKTGAEFETAKYHNPGVAED
jgi:OmcA/MtrC family decaheme c-type cytochrome